MTINEIICYFVVAYSNKHSGRRRPKIAKRDRSLFMCVMGNTMSEWKTLR